ncbi:MAG: T9SS type A sorting domain-containing protein [Ignavibacteria bacterium]
MKKIFVLFFLFLFSNSYSNYSTPGTGVSWTMDSLVTYSNGGVTAELWGYNLMDTISVSSADTIKVLSNCTIKMSMNIKLIVRGTLIINPPDSVLVTALDTLLAPLGFEFLNASSVSMLRKMIFEYCSSIDLVNSNILIDSCVIRKNYPNNIQSSGSLDMSQSDPVISNCQFYRNANQAISMTDNANSSPKIINNLFYANNLYTDGPAVQIYIADPRANTSVYFTGNRVYGTYNGAAGSINVGGVAVRSTSITAFNVFIENNIIKRNNYGLLLQTSWFDTLKIINNTIDSNNAFPNDSLNTGYGIRYQSGFYSACILQNNKVRGNLFGVIQQSGFGGGINLGDLSMGDTNNTGLNKIYGNKYKGKEYAFITYDTNKIKAENNYWGTDNADSILAHMYIIPGGSVDFTPYINFVGISEPGEIVKKDFYLFYAYPNPFNPSSNIVYSLPSSKYVRVSIYNILGNRIKLLVNERQNAGNYTIKFDAQDLSSGIYFYRLEVEGFTQTKRLVHFK